MGPPEIFNSNLNRTKLEQELSKEVSGQSGLPMDSQAAAYAARTGAACANNCWGRSHLIQLIVVLELLLLCALYGQAVLVAVLVSALTVLLCAAIFFRLTTIALSITGNPEIRVSAEAIKKSEEADLPVYTILVPLFREADVVTSCVDALQHIRYPRDKLDIKLLLEADDEVTRAALVGAELGEEFEAIHLEPTYPRTKPKACNRGLEHARGDFVVIYDAEDRPEPDQLLKVVYAFRHSPQPVDCFQAKLNYTNARENYLTKFFTIEYTVWFDFFLPGLQRLGAPIPLGGTSNHFRTDALRELGGWDPFNVTEDCDLGIRLAAMNKRVQIVDSTTWEEANSRLGNWLRQRSRWNKGYLQTHFVHTKSLRKLRLALGTYRTVLFLLTVGGNALIQLMCVVLWISFLVYTALLAGDALAGRDPWMVVAGDRAEFRWAWKMLYLDAGEHVVLSKVSVICFAGSLVMLFSNLLIIGTNVMACFRRGYKDLWPWALLSPVYWILMSLGAWRGLLQLVRRPHYWEKTQHGISKEMTPVVVEHHRAR